MKIFFKCALAIGVTLAACAALNAQAPTPASADPDPRRLHDPTRLPGDMAPPPLNETLEVRPPNQRGPGVPPPDRTPGPPLSLSIEAAQAAIDACKTQGLLVGVAITDAAGVLRVGLAADGAAPPGRIYGAVPKNLAAIAFKKPTSAIRAQLRADPSESSRVKPNMLVLPGGVPLMVGDRVIGAIGVSGASADQDEVCALAGVEKIKARLK